MSTCIELAKQTLREAGYSVMKGVSRPEINSYNHAIIYDAHLTHCHNHSNSNAWLADMHEELRVVNSEPEAIALITRLSFIRKWMVRAIELQPVQMTDDQVRVADYWTPLRNMVDSQWEPTRTKGSVSEYIIPRRLTREACGQLCTEMNSE
jgi:hypothetical protein